MTTPDKNPCTDPTAWFEALYAAADTDGRGVPWAKMAPNPYLVNWLNESSINPEGKSALVVGCGLGDDAEEFSQRGFMVTAFDISVSAIQLCQQRFPDSPVNYQVADLFAAPEAWLTTFDLVFENITVQALPPDLQEKAIQHITPFVAPGGQLFVVTSARQPEHSPSGPPWPLSRASLDRYQDDGLREVFLNTQTLQPQPLILYIQALYQR